MVLGTLRSVPIQSMNCAEHGAQRKNERTLSQPILLNFTRQFNPRLHIPPSHNRPPSHPNVTLHTHPYPPVRSKNIPPAQHSPLPSQPRRRPSRTQRNLCAHKAQVQPDAAISHSIRLAANNLSHLIGKVRPDGVARDWRYNMRLGDGISITGGNARDGAWIGIKM